MADIDEIEKQEKLEKEEAEAKEKLNDYWDKIDEVKQNVRKYYKQVKDLERNQKITGRSIVASGRHSIFYFPVFCSNSLTINEAHAIAKMYERVYADFVQNAISQRNRIVKQTDFEDLKFLKQYHTNIINESGYPLDRIFGCEALDKTEQMIYNSCYNLLETCNGFMISYQSDEIPDEDYIAEHKRNISESLTGLSYIKEANDNEIEGNNAIDKVSVANKIIPEIQKSLTTLTTNQIKDIENIRKEFQDIESLSDELKDNESFNQIKKKIDNNKFFSNAFEKNRISITYTPDTLSRIQSRKTHQNSQADEYLLFQQDMASLGFDMNKSQYITFDELQKKLNKDRSYKIINNLLDLGDIKKINSLQTDLNTIQEQIKETNSNMSFDPTNKKLGDKARELELKEIEIRQKLELANKEAMLNCKEKFKTIDQRKKLYQDSLIKLQNKYGTLSKDLMDLYDKQIGNLAKNTKQAKWDELSLQRRSALKQAAASAGTKQVQMIKDTDIKKINGMLPYNINIELWIEPSEANRDLRAINLQIGIKTVLHLVDPNDLEDELDGIMGGSKKRFDKIRLQTGEINWLQYIFKSDENKKDLKKTYSKNKNWIQTLKKLGKYKDTYGSLFKSVLPTLTGFQRTNAPIPNATMVLTAIDVDNIKLNTGYDFSKESVVSKFASQMFIIAFVIVDSSTRTIKTLYPGETSRWDLVALDTIEDLIARSSNQDFMKELKRSINR